jgi:hypothetical protein
MIWLLGDHNRVIVHNPPMTYAVVLHDNHLLHKLIDVRCQERNISVGPGDGGSTYI